jgi:hypothetical protein
MKDDITDRTPEELKCVSCACPRIYEVTSRDMQCAAMACNSIYADKKSKTYLIVGKQVNPEAFGLAKKVGQGESLIQVPKDLIDKMQKD